MTRTEQWYQVEVNGYDWDSDHYQEHVYNYEFDDAEDAMLMYNWIKSLGSGVIGFVWHQEPHISGKLGITHGAINIDTVKCYLVTETIKKESVIE